MKKEIIVNIDPFNIQHQVVEYAIKIARRLDLPLLLFSVQQHTVMPIAAETGGQMYSIQELPPDWGTTVEQKAKDYCDEITRAYPNTRFEHELGMLADSVTTKLSDLYNSVSRRSPYLLVMPKTHDFNWWNDVIGTAETAIASEAPCPVLFVPENAELGEVNRILYLADRQSLENHEYPGFKFLNAISTNLGAKITAGFIAGEIANDPFYNSGAAMEMFRRSLPDQTDHEFRFFASLDADWILELAKLTHTDIVAFPFREANLFERFFDNEVTRELVLKADVPTLVF